MNRPQRVGKAEQDDGVRIEDFPFETGRESLIVLVLGRLLLFPGTSL